MWWCALRLAGNEKGVRPAGAVGMPCDVRAQQGGWRPQLQCVGVHFFCLHSRVDDVVLRLAHMLRGDQVPHAVALARHPRQGDHQLRLHMEVCELCEQQKVAQVKPLLAPAPSHEGCTARLHTADEQAEYLEVSQSSSIGTQISSVNAHTRNSPPDAT